MVSSIVSDIGRNCLTLAQQANRAPLEQLDPPTRAAVIMTIFGLVLLGLALVAAVMIGGRWVRRMARQRPRRSGAVRELQSAADARRLRELLAGELPAVETSSTVQIDRGTEDTKVD
jgi:hypothetical protein